MLIDDYAPEYDIASRHHIDVEAAPDAVYAAARTLDLRRSTLIRVLFRLRGLPTHRLDMEGFLSFGFVLLDEVPQQEFVLGLIGRFWTTRGALQRFEPAAFRPFDQPGYAKAAWTFYLDPQPEGPVRLITETRVQCTDAASLHCFRRYWRLVGPFSGLVRREMLRVIKQEAEDFGF